MAEIEKEESDRKEKRNAYFVSILGIQNKRLKFAAKRECQRKEYKKISWFLLAEQMFQC